MKWLRRPSETPLWRDEFSVFTADERYVNRRQFAKFLTLTSFAMLAGNLWILARSLFRRAAFVSRAGRRPDRRGARRRRQDLLLSHERRPLHPGPRHGRVVGGLQPEMHASLLRRVLLPRTEPARLPLPPGVLFDRRRRVLQGPPRRPLPRVALERQRRTDLRRPHGRRRRMNPHPPQNRGLTAIDGAMALIVVLLIVQIWLLSATLESYLAGHREAAVPGAIISGDPLPRLPRAIPVRGPHRFRDTEKLIRLRGSMHPGWRKAAPAPPASRLPPRAFRPRRCSRIPCIPACRRTGTGRCASSGPPKHTWSAARRCIPVATAADAGSLRAPPAADVLSEIARRPRRALRRGPPGHAASVAPASSRLPAEYIC